MDIKINLSVDDRKKVICKKFEVPEKCRKIIVEKKYASSIESTFRNKIDISFFDETDRWYGRFDRYKEVFTVDSEDIFTENISSGIWEARFEVFQIYEELEICIEIGFELYEEYDHFRGELHTHTTATDGKLSLDEVREYIKENKYDFFFLTDHNSIADWKNLESTDNLSGFIGLELTTFYGHILLLGVNDFVSWHGDNGEIKELHQIRNDVQNKNGLMGLAHPYACGGPACAGCRWEGEINPELFDFIEVWNSKLDNCKNNWEAVDFWIETLKKDIRIFCSCGADLHRRGDLDPALKTIALSVKNNELSILDALRKGRYYLSSGGEVKLNVNGKTFGQSINTGINSVNIDYELKNFEKNTDLFFISKSGMKKLKKSEDAFDWKPDFENDFAILMGMDDKRNLDFMTNPIFIKTISK